MWYNQLDRLAGYIRLLLKRIQLPFAKHDTGFALLYPDRIRVCLNRDIWN